MHITVLVLFYFCFLATYLDDQTLCDHSSHIYFLPRTSINPLPFLTDCHSTRSSCTRSSRAILARFPSRFPRALLTADRSGESARRASFMLPIVHPSLRTAFQISARTLASLNLTPLNCFPNQHRKRNPLSQKKRMWMRKKPTTPRQITSPPRVRPEPPSLPRNVLISSSTPRP